MQRKEFADLKICVRIDWTERSTYFARRIRFHVPRIELRRCAEVEDEDARFLRVAGIRRAQGLQRGEF